MLRVDEEVCSSWHVVVFNPGIQEKSQESGINCVVLESVSMAPHLKKRMTLKEQFHRVEDNLKIKQIRYNMLIVKL